MKAFDVRQAVREICSLTGQRDAMIEKSADAQYRKRFRRSSQRGGKTDGWNCGATLVVARALALHDPAIAVFQREINRGVSDLDRRINLGKTARTMLEQRVRQIPGEIRELEAQKKQWEKRFVCSTGPDRKQAQGMINSIDRKIAEKKRELKGASNRSGKNISFPSAFEIVAGPGYEVSQLGFSDSGHEFSEQWFGGFRYPDIGLSKKKR